jgi:hypothetical protein
LCALWARAAMPWIDFNPLCERVLAQASERIATLSRVSPRPKVVTLLRVGEHLTPSQVAAYRHTERVAQTVGCVPNGKAAQRK